MGTLCIDNRQLAGSWVNSLSIRAADTHIIMKLMELIAEISNTLYQEYITLAYICWVIFTCVPLFSTSHVFSTSSFGTSAHD